MRGLDGWTVDHGRLYTAECGTDCGPVRETAYMVVPEDFDGELPEWAEWEKNNKSCSSCKHNKCSASKCGRCLGNNPYGLGEGQYPYHEWEPKQEPKIRLRRVDTDSGAVELWSDGHMFCQLIGKMGLMGINKKGKIVGDQGVYCNSAGSEIRVPIGRTITEPKHSEWV